MPSDTLGRCVSCGKQLEGAEYVVGHECIWRGVEGMTITGPISALIPGYEPGPPLPPTPARVVAVDFDAKTITFEVGND